MHLYTNANDRPSNLPGPWKTCPGGPRAFAYTPEPGLPFQNTEDEGSRPGRPHASGRKGLRPQRPLPLPDLLPGRHVARGWVGVRGEGKGTRRAGESAGSCGVTMTTGPEAACEVTRTRLAPGHVSVRGGAALGPAPDAHVPGARTWTPDPNGWQRLRYFPSHAAVDPSRMLPNLPSGQPEKGEQLVVDRGHLGWHWRCSATEEAGRGGIGGLDTERVTGIAREGQAEKHTKIETA